jgi:hypothetical protein
MSSPVQSSARADTILRLLPAIEQVSDPDLRTAVVEIWIEAWETSAWDDLEDVPKAIYAQGEIHCSLVEHVRAVTAGSIGFADAMEEIHGRPCDRDLLLSAALLHDASKVVESAPSEDGRPVVSEIGRMLQHGVWTAQRVLARGLRLELAHLIVSHTPMSKTTPLIVEGLILYYVDMLDSDVLSLHAGLPLWIAE